MPATATRPKRERRIKDQAEREAFKAQRRQEERERMAEAVAALATTEGWRRWMEARSRFRTYSVHNQLLIAFQRPDATRVAGFRTWQSLGRQVRKGERSIRILAPMRVSSEKRQDGGRTEPEADSTDERETRLLFRAVPVFDIGQTDGEPLPEPPREPITGESHADRVPRLEAFATQLGYGVTFRDLSGSAAGGWCDYGRQAIVVDSTGPPNSQVRTLVHELAHALGASTKDYGRDDAEVIADCAAFIACGSAGLDTSGESVPYVAGWSNGDTDALTRLSQTVDGIAKRLEDALGVE